MSLIGLGDVSAAREEACFSLASSVARARDAGVSYVQIGRFLGISDGRVAQIDARHRRELRRGRLSPAQESIAARGALAALASHMGLV